jgi:hypothetical protein
MKLTYQIDRQLAAIRPPRARNKKGGSEIMTLEAVKEKAGEGNQESPLSQVLNQISRIQSLGAAFLAMAEKEDLSSQFGTKYEDLVELMIEQINLLESKLEAAEA